MGPMRDLDDVLREALPASTTPAARRATESLRDTYRSGAPPRELAIADDERAAAYAAYRMPATRAAIARTLAELPEDVPPPRIHLDLGGGTGAAVWAVHARWPQVHSRVLDASAPALALGRRLALGSDDAGLAATTWEQVRLAAGVALPATDLTTVSYLLGELPAAVAGDVVDAALAASSTSVLVVEPGTPRGYAAVLAARDRALAAGWRIVAPCPHAGPCPLTAGDWCHAAVRLTRSSLHRRLKSGDLGHEDEKFSYLAVVAPGAGDVAGEPAGRVLRHPLTRKGLVQLRLCTPEGGVRDEVVSKRQGERYRRARETGWGDTFT